jgi:hypothetical protein
MCAAVTCFPQGYPEKLGITEIGWLKRRYQKLAFPGNAATSCGYR